MEGILERDEIFTKKEEQWGSDMVSFKVNFGNMGVGPPYNVQLEEHTVLLGNELTSYKQVDYTIGEKGTTFPVFSSRLGKRKKSSLKPEKRLSHQRLASVQEGKWIGLLRTEELKKPKKGKHESKSVRSLNNSSELATVKRISKCLSERPEIKSFL
ncbi:hypothetical protein BTVI_37888 [Pitangus sulphuratus]|nr:hypothetical protein BTVI_37888 [Pitangus sulphuratus]